MSKKKKMCIISLVKLEIIKILCLIIIFLQNVSRSYVRPIIFKNCNK